MTLKTTKLKNAIDDGDCIPVNEINSVGRWVEDTLESKGHNVNRSSGVDLPDCNVEIKTRNVNSKSAHTIGSMTTDSIINTPYDQSPIKDKIQIQYRVEYNSYGDIHTNGNFDFTEPWLQDLIRKAYESGRQEISNGMNGKNNTKTYGVGIFQKDKHKDQWQFRITNAGMKKIKRIAKQPSFKHLFKY